jgi:hypothetical protein
MSPRVPRPLAHLLRPALAGVFAVLSGVGARRVEAQISPGPLARAHRQLEGATNCAQCHGLKREPMTRQCLACHKEIGWLLERNRGYHATEARATKKECAQCHPDHAGADFQLVEWPGGSRERFDHRKAGWALDGAHAEANCEGCHATRYRVAPPATLSERRSNAGWIGLETTCVSCHRDDDAHKGDLGRQCADCHDSRDWAPAPKFDHNKTDYPLTGRHGDVECARCHVTPKLPVRTNEKGERVGTFKPVPYRECASCHADPHKGALSAKCSNCHVTRGFGVIDKSDFDHQLTKYPLRGRHASVKCESCHGAGLANRTPAFATCAACHADVHGGEGTVAGTPADCAACHSVSGFSPSTFTVAQHQKTKYALDGRHASVKCTLCHTPGPVTTRAAARRTTQLVARLRPASGACSSCHTDAHGGELAARADKGTCETCHSTAGFAPSSFDATAHASLRVTLEGRHGKVACAACHGPARPGLAPLPAPASRKARLTIALRETACASCHVDPHAGRYRPTGGQPVTGSCGSCHDAVQWRPATMSVAVHATFSYPLEGAHRAVPCVGCHEEFKARQAASTLLLAARGVAQLPFTAKRETNCGSCHDSPHGRQFDARRDEGACEGCHTVTAFVPASAFDHERDAAFSLKGAHAKVACASCHRAATPGAPILYRPLSPKCESCHAGTPGGRRA